MTALPHRGEPAQHMQSSRSAASDPRQLRLSRAGHNPCELWKCLKTTVEVGGIEPAAGPFLEFLFRLVQTYSPCSGRFWTLSLTTFDGRSRPPNRVNSASRYSRVT